MINWKLPRFLILEAGCCKCADMRHPTVGALHVGTKRRAGKLRRATKTPSCNSRYSAASVATSFGLTGRLVKHYVDDSSSASEAIRCAFAIMVKVEGTAGIDGRQAPSAR